MAGVIFNTASIERKAKEYINSKDGRERARKILRDIVKSGRISTGIGNSYSGFIFDENKMIDMAYEYIDFICAEASYSGVPSSVILSCIKCASVDNPIETGANIYTVNIHFTNLHRDSLYSAKYPAEGVDNIVALFNSTYEASTHRYGRWTSPGHNNKLIRGVLSTPGDGFMQRAARKFNAKSWLNRVKAYVGDEYM